MLQLAASTLTNWDFPAILPQRRSPKVESVLGRNHKEQGSPMTNAVSKKSFPLGLKIQ